MKISSQYNWLAELKDAPKMVLEAIKLGKLNTSEYAGYKSNPEIMALAKEAGIGDIYKTDEIAWCAVANTVLALRAGKEVPFTGFNRLRAYSFLRFGVHTDIPMLGDTLVFQRPGGYHVAIYIGEDDECYHIAGGNQSNQYNIIRIAKSRLLEARRPVYKIGQPESVKRIFLLPQGVPSSDES